MASPEYVGTVSYEADIRPLFREIDVAEMNFLLDLTDIDDVRTYAQGIYERVADGTMPCDEPWPQDQVELFKRWIDGGCLD